MHYEEFKQRDPRVLRALIEAFPFATITVNTPDGLISAHAPVTFRQGTSANGTVEFHLANGNPITPHLQNGAKPMITINGPSAAISPSWYTARFPGDKPDRSHTAPTYNYINANLSGTVQVMDLAHLTKQIGDLTKAHEPQDGWQVKEIDPEKFRKWRGFITGFRVPIESFDMTAKLSQEQNPADKPGIIAGLQKRGAAGDLAMATMVGLCDGAPGKPASPESLIKAINAVGTQSAVAQYR